MIATAGGTAARHHTDPSPPGNPALPEQPETFCLYLDELPVYAPDVQEDDLLPAAGAAPSCP
jgi:hypothetical protein